MKFATIFTIVIIASLQIATANFDIYFSGVGANGVSQNVWGYQIYEEEATCHTRLGWVWRQLPDVSGGKFGVRCEGCKTKDPSDIKVMEMNFNRKKYHWTIYQDRAYYMYDLWNNVVGQCIPFPAPQLYCGLPIGRMEGIRKLRCLTKVTAAQINAAQP